MTNSDPITPAPAIEPPLSAPKKILRLAGWLFVMLWAAWWAVSLYNGQLLFGREAWLLAWPYLGCDFEHSYLAAKLLAEGGNPFTQGFGRERGFAYPPIVLLLHSWCALFSFRVAYIIVAISIAAVMSFAVVQALTVRRALGLKSISLPWALGCVLFSSPVVFVMERGNFDAMMILLLALMAIASRMANPRLRDLTLGICLAIAIWIKVYPAILIGGLIALRAWRATAIAVAGSVVIGIVSFMLAPQWMTSSSHNQRDRMVVLQDLLGWLKAPLSHQPYIPADPINHFSHSMSVYWYAFWNSLGLSWIAHLPGLLGAGIVLGLLAIWVTYYVWRSANPTSLIFPYFLWLCALSTFAMPVSADYNLTTLPIAIIVLWSRRLSIANHVLFGVFLLWWQPMMISMPHQADVFFFVKLAGLIGVAMAIVRLAREATKEPTIQVEVGRSSDTRNNEQPVSTNIGQS